MATGDITAAVIDSSGYILELTATNLSTGGTYSTGMTSLGDPASAKVVVTLTSQGFLDDGTTTTLSRTVYGTVRKTQLFPNETISDETVSGSDVIIRVALSDYVYQGDSSITATISAGLYTQGTATNAASLSVTNNSTVAYQKVVANWSLVPYQRATSNTLRLSCLAYERHGQYGRPVRAVKFICTDGTTTTTAWALEPRIDPTRSDPAKVTEYYVDIDVSGMTQGAALTCNFEAYPWIGDSNSPQKTASSGYTQPTPHPAPLTFLCDRTGAYGVTVAVVDSATGVDASGVAVDYASFNSASPPSAFLTIGGAANAIRAYNNTNRSRADVGAGIIYLRTGNHSWIGATGTFGSQPGTWLTVETFPGDAQATINAQSAGTDISDRVKLKNINFTSTTNNTITNCQYLWMDSCTLNSTTATPVATIAMWYITNNTVTAFNQGLRPFSTTNMCPVLVRGNTLAAAAKNVFVYTACGNVKTEDSLTGIFINDIPGMLGPKPDQTILAYNKIYKINSVSITGWAFWENYNTTIGGAIIANVVEGKLNSTTGTTAMAASEGVLTNEPVNNVIIAHNTLVGGKNNWAYNSDSTLGSVSKSRKYWAMINNCIDDVNWKGHDFTGTSGGDAARTGNLPILYSVGFRGNYFAEATGIGGAGSFNGYWTGLYSKFERTATESSTVVAFVDRKSWDGSVNGAGGGDYHLQSTSPARSLNSRLAYIPFDIDGRPIVTVIPGAFSDPSNSVVGIHNGAIY